MTPTEVTQAGPISQASDQLPVKNRSSFPRYGWALVPIVTWSTLAFLPFLALAVTRRRARDWGVFIAYAAAEVAAVAALASGGALAVAIPVMVMIAAAVHAFIEYSPGRAPNPRSAPPGWHRDPAGRYAQRWWTGYGWSAHARHEAIGYFDPLPAAGPGGFPPEEVNDELAHLHYVELFLERARAERVLSAETYRVLLAKIASRQERLTGVARTRLAAPVSADEPCAGEFVATRPDIAAGAGLAAVFPSVVPSVSPPSVTPARPERRPKEPGAAKRWWDAARDTVKSELAVHGLAYLGVLLLFTGMFGLVVFSSSAVRVGLRPITEAAVPVAVFGSAMLLGRRKRVVPARALTVLGGLLLLVVTLAAFVDGAPVPPDPAGFARVVALAATPAALAVIYALWARRRPASPLRHLIAPALWLAVAMAALAWARPIPSGQHIVTPRPGQMAAVLVAIAVTLVVSRSAAGRLLPAGLFPAGLVGLGIAVLLEALAAGAAGWPALPVAISGTAVAAAIELSGSQVQSAVRTVLQGTVVILTCLAMIPELGVGWAGVIAAAAGLALIEVSMRRTVAAQVLLVPAVVAAAGLVAAARDSAALLVASATVAGWAHSRRLWPNGWPYPALLTITAAIAPAGVLASLVAVLPTDLGAGVAGLLVLSACVCARARGRPADRFWSWWLPVAAGTVLAATAGQQASGWVVMAAAAASATFALAPARWVLRVWLGSAATLWSTWLVFEVAGLEFSVRVLAIAGAALLAVGVTASLRSQIAGHIGLVGHLTGLACWLIAALEAGSLKAWLPTAVLGLAATGTAITTAAQETHHAAVPDLLARAGARLMRGRTDRDQTAGEETLRRIPAVITALALIPFVAFLPALHVPEPPEQWRPLTLSVLALAYVLLARLMWPAWARVARVFADVGPWVAVLAAAICDVRGPALAAMAAVLVMPALARPVLRRWVNSWVSWVATVPFAVLAANLLGLPMSYWYAVVLGWGAVLLIAGLATDDLRAGRREPGVSVRVRWLVPPVAVGALASVAGLVGSAGQPAAQIGWALIAAAVVVGVTGMLLRAGLLGGVGATMATGGFAAVVPWSLGDHPWLLLVVAAIWLAAAEASRHVSGVRALQRLRLWQRWDLPLFVVAHLVAIVGLGLAVVTDTAVAVTAVCGGALALAVSARVRRWPWAIAGTALILAGSVVAGARWACLAFAGTAILATVLATGRQGRLRVALQVAGVFAAAGAWAAGLVWGDVSPAVAVEATSVAAGSVVLVAAVATRITGAAAEWARVWGATAFALTLASAMGLADSAVPPDARFFVAASLVAASVGFGLAAGPLRFPLLREAAVVTALLAGAVAAAGPGRVNPEALTWVAVTAGLLASGFILAAWSRPKARQWVRPALVASAAATVSAFVGAVLAVPDRTLLVPSFVLAAVLFAAFAVALRRPSLRAAVPVPLCAAWIAYASEAVAGQPQWYTVPTGLAIVAIAGLLRSARRAEGRPVATPDVIALEITGMTMILGASVVQAVTRGSFYALVGAGLALALTGWGALTHVRRRLLGGAAGFVLSLLLLIAIPLIRVLPNLGGVVVWLSLAGVGVIAIVAAVLLDATRAAIKRGAERFTDLTKGWE